MISESERLAALPDLPTAKEQGLDYQMTIWAGIFALKDRPKEIVGNITSKGRWTMPA
jgi:tripartite-type tricarboxylate transporter receptor subunit TctC